MKKLFSLLLLAGTMNLTAQTNGSYPESLLLVPEKSNFEKTSSYADMMQFLNSIKTMSPNVYLGSIGTSTLGKDIPMAVLAQPAVSSPEQAKASGKPVVYIQGNIHGGEVEGKEVCMMLMRDILLGSKKELLNNQIIVFVPMYNTDGNDKMAKGLRPSQENSPLETGTRENGQGLDLNRDGIKMEAPETKAMVQNILNAWDPQMVVDLHTTNGTWHGYSLTWAPGYRYAGQAGPYEYTYNKMLPYITQQVKEKNDLFFGPFGDFNVREGWPLKFFYTYNHHPRYIINQIGLRNRMSILSEAFAHERFYQRINSTYHFVYEILDYCNKNASEILRINREAEANAIQNVLDNAGKIQKGVRYKMVPQAKPLNHFRTYDYISYTKPDGSTTYTKTGKIVHYDNVNYYADFKDTVQATLPRGYIIPAAFAHIAAHLKQQGAVVVQADKKQVYSGEVFLIEKFSKSPRKFEGHQMASAEGRYQQKEFAVQKGDFIIDLAQPLANLIFYTLEPQSDDGLLTWNFFDEYLESKGVATSPVEFPVFKYFSTKTTGKKK
ncbi:MAG: M14 family metallopeptidase [Sediminibacterium sp.]|nr:M14 family metallopeptidase [Sediminibacterium sp.]